MKSGRSHIVFSDGFTIVEVMIVLAVTSAILISAMSLIGGSQNRTSFSQAVNDINTQITSTATNVANGYFASELPTTSACNATGSNGVPKFVTGGTNDGSCVYIGRVIQFTKNQDFYFHNVMGRRQSGAPLKEVTTMSAAEPQIIERISSLASTSTYPLTSQKKLLQGGLKVGEMAFNNGSGWQPTSGIAFTGSLAAYNSTGSVESGAQTVDFVATVDNRVTDTKESFIRLFDTTFAGLYNSQKNPSQGIRICFDSGTTVQVAIITVGGGSRRTTTSTEFKKGKCSDAANKVLP